MGTIYIYTQIIFVKIQKIQKTWNFNWTQNTVKNYLPRKKNQWNQQWISLEHRWSLEKSSQSNKRRNVKQFLVFDFHVGKLFFGKENWINIL